MSFNMNQFFLFLVSFDHFAFVVAKVVGGHTGKDTVKRGLQRHISQTYYSDISFLFSCHKGCSWQEISLEYLITALLCYILVFVVTLFLVYCCFGALKCCLKLSNPKKDNNSGEIMVETQNEDN